MTWKIAISIFIFIIGFMAGSFIDSFLISGRTISENREAHSFTKAICNPNNECIDILVYCENNKIVKLEPSSELIKIDKVLNRNDSEFCG